MERVGAIGAHDGEGRIGPHEGRHGRRLRIENAREDDHAGGRRARLAVEHRAGDRAPRLEHETHLEFPGRGRRREVRRSAGDGRFLLNRRRDFLDLSFVSRASDDDGATGLGFGDLELVGAVIARRRR